MLKRLAHLLSLMLLAACNVEIPDVEICGTSGLMTAGGDCSHTLSDSTRQLNLDEWIAFLEPDVTTGRGAALCMSSDDFTKLKTALDKACVKLGRWCSKEIKEQAQKTTARVEALQYQAMEKKRKRRHHR